jgi:hypothetical protein
MCELALILPSLLVPSSATASLTQETQACIAFRYEYGAFLKYLVILQNLSQITKGLVYNTSEDSIPIVFGLFSFKKIYMYLVILAACFGRTQLTTIKYGALCGPVCFSIFHTA